MYMYSLPPLLTNGGLKVARTRYVSPYLILQRN